MRLLLVEDDKDLSEFVCDWLSREGFVIDTAANGEQALHQAEESDYDVILLDVMMPRVDGYTVLKNLRSKGYKGAILLVTCKGQEKDKLQGLNNGADDYIVKPFLLTGARGAGTCRAAPDDGWNIQKGREDFPSFTLANFRWTF